MWSREDVSVYVHRCTYNVFHFSKARARAHGGALFLRITRVSPWLSSCFGPRAAAHLYTGPQAAAAPQVSTVRRENYQSEWWARVSELFERSISYTYIQSSPFIFYKVAFFSSVILWVFCFLVSCIMVRFFYYPFSVYLYYFESVLRKV